ncbi:surface lipoprotein assembly modifier [Hoeflea sp. G2-23]|uniref:Surface lipoprotein assembly modifier n=1 Tax=Hoeflea algicola TaxID=2983763 RepID=A0ABT3Z960_9HYPH|nr:surface lipoprotein assembly modifier [Hoeflea algicola]MCY0148231.1 surface lipoprotein assembly modifier [Hoeflea algicola]
MIASLLAALLLATPVHANIQTQTPFRTAETLVAAGDYPAAERILAKSRFQGAEAIPAAYLLAVVYARTGRPDRAEMILREILSRQPDIDAVRIELVKVLAIQGKRQAAGYHLNQVTDVVDLERDRGQLEQLSRRIGATEGFSLSGYFSLAPSTNVNDGTTQSTVMIGGLPFQIANSARQQSGVGFKAGAVAGYSHALTEKTSLYGALSAGVTDYSNDQYDQQQGEIRAGIRHSELRYTLQAEAIIDRRWQNLKRHSYAIGGRLSGKWNFSQGWWASGEIIHMDRSYDGNAAANTRTTRATASIRRSFSTRLALSLSGSFERETDPARPWNSYDSRSGTVGLETALGFGVRMHASLTGGTRDFKSPFPGLGLVREDKFWEVRSSFRKDGFQIAGFSPIIGIFHKAQSSNVAFFDYQSSGMDLTFTKAF